MKIYFAGSIRGEKADKGTYLKIVEYLRNYGTVLTEHVADKNITQMGEKSVSGLDIYKRDIRWLTESDLIVAEVSSVSFGVGYEIREGELQMKPILELYQPQNGRSLSPMIQQGKETVVKEYSGLQEALKHIDEFLSFKEACPKCENKLVCAEGDKICVDCGYSSK